MVERRSPKPDVEGSSPSWPVASLFEDQGAVMKKIIQFFKESYAELAKVVWPSKEDVISSTKVVIFSTVAVALVLGLIDFFLVLGIEAVFR
jgi:preprotein translocase subunit SecE